MSPPSVPTYEDILWPTLKALEANGGSASIEELSDSVAQIMELSDEVLDVPHLEGPRSKFEYRSAWARTHLKYIDAVENSERGVWAITDVGRRMPSDAEVRKLVKEERVRLWKARKARQEAVADEIDEATSEASWEDALLAILRELKPDAFERLCQRIAAQG